MKEHLLDSDYVFKEKPWHLILHLFLWFVGTASLLILMVADGWGDQLFLVCAIVLTIPVSLYDLLTLRTVGIGPRGLYINQTLLRWSDIERHAFREVPPIKAGLLLQLTEAHRQKLDKGPPKFELGDQRYDYHLRVYGDEIVEWFDVLAIYTMQASSRKMAATTRALVESADSTASPLLPGGRNPSSAPHPTQRHSGSGSGHANLEVRLVTDTPLTIAVDTPSLAALETSARTIAKAAPDSVRFNPGYTGELMLLLGPLSLAETEGMDAAVTSLEETVAEEFPGEVAVHSAWAEERAAGDVE